MNITSFAYFPENYTATVGYPGNEKAYRIQQAFGKIELEQISAKEWDLMASRYADLFPEQMGSFNCGHWGDENLEFLVFKHKTGPIGGAAMLVKKIPFTNTGIAILKWGPVFQPIGQKFDVVLYSKIIDTLKDEYCFRRNYNLTIMPPARPGISDECESILIAQGFEAGEFLPAPERYLVNVQDDPELLLKNLDQKWRYNLRKALKNNFDIRIATPTEGLENFLKLYRKMLDRKKFNDSSAIDALENVIKNSPASIRPMIVLVSHENEVTAGGIIDLTGDMASYMFGATDERALKLKAGYALHWWVANYLISQEHIQWYDLGGNDRDRGLHQFKKGFVGKSGHIVISPPKFHFANSFTARFVGLAAFKTRNILARTRGMLHVVKRNR